MKNSTIIENICQEKISFFINKISLIKKRMLNKEYKGLYAKEHLNPKKVKKNIMNGLRLILLSQN